MKKILLIVLVAVVALGVGVLSVDHYQKYQNKQTQDAVAAADQAAANERAKQERLDKVLAAYDRERIECEKGAAAYDALTALAKARTTRPSCGPAVLQ